MKYNHKKIQFKKDLPDPDYKMGEWVRVSADINQNCDLKSGVVVGYLWEDSYSYFVRIESCNGLPCDKIVERVPRYRVLPTTLEVPEITRGRFSKIEV